MHIDGAYPHTNLPKARLAFYQVFVSENQEITQHIEQNEPVL